MSCPGPRGALSTSGAGGPCRPRGLGACRPRSPGRNVGLGDRPVGHHRVRRGRSPSRMGAGVRLDDRAPLRLGDRPGRGQGSSRTGSVADRAHRGQGDVKDRVRHGQGPGPARSASPRRHGSLRTRPRFASTTGPRFTSGRGTSGTGPVGDGVPVRGPLYRGQGLGLDRRTLDGPAGSGRHRLSLA